MDLTLKVDKGAVSGRLIVKDQFGNEITIANSGYTTSDGNIFQVTGDDSGFQIQPTGVGSATFSYTANGLSGSGTIIIEQAAPVPTTIDFEITAPQP